MWTLASESEYERNAQHNDMHYVEEWLTDESGGSTSDGGIEDGKRKDERKMSSESEESQKDSDHGGKEISTESRLPSLKDHVTRITQFLTELKALSESCQEYIPAIEYEINEDGELHRERQVSFDKCLLLSCKLKLIRIVFILFYLKE